MEWILNTTDTTPILGQKHICAVPRLVMAAPHGHSGKTTITVGLLGALTRRKVRVQPFKKGPDFIDPSWLSYAAGRACRNLDRFWMDDTTILQSFTQGCRDADMAIVEGNMGLYDGMDVQGTGSTAELSKSLQAPVILIVDATRMTRSAAAMVMGFQHFDPQTNIVGVILNKVARSRHESMLRQTIEQYCGLPVIGAVPKNTLPTFPERHLGLIPAGEYNQVTDSIEKTIDIVSQTVDIDKLIAIAQGAPALEIPKLEIKTVMSPRATIGVIRDQAFSFYYPENLESLVAAGAQLVEIDACSDIELPAIDGLYIGGGFPELFAEQLENNAGLRRDIRYAIEAGLPVYAECGGLMYLGRRIFWQGHAYNMVGALPYDVVVEKKPQGHGYTIMKITQDNPWFPTGAELKGHEFHHSRVVNVSSDLTTAMQVERGTGLGDSRDGFIYRNTFASYNHLHAATCPDWARNFVDIAVECLQNSKYVKTV
jgi:cobyrinic acid a,c-diamide synthase